MYFEEGYDKYLVLTESNGTTNKLSTDRGRFAIQYNIAQNKVIEWLIEANANDENRYIQSIKNIGKKLDLKQTSNNYNEYSLPEDYFEFLDLIVSGSKELCKDKPFRVQEVKIENVSNLLTDKFSEPSFKYRETFYTIASDKIQVYKKDFTLDNIELSYYRYPKQVEQIVPDNPESSFKKEKFEFDDKLINRILFMTASYHELFSDDQKYQAFKQETIQKF